MSDPESEFIALVDETREYGPPVPTLDDYARALKPTPPVRNEYPRTRRWRIRDATMVVAAASLLWAATTLLVSPLFDQAPGAATNVHVNAALSSACTTTAASTSYANVNTVVQAASDGDVICIPAGTATWASTLAISGKSITLKGVLAGTKAQCDVGGQTTYTCIKGAQSLLTYATIATGSPRITAITWYTTACSDCSTYDKGAVTITGSSGSFRMDHSRIDHTGGGGLVGTGYVRGVVDQNAFVINTALTHSIVWNHTTWLNDASPYGDKSWSTASSIGTSEAMYFEQNTYGSTTGLAEFCVDHNHGSRVVHRYETATNCQFADHGTESGGRYRSAKQREMYRNTITWTLSLVPSVIDSRGGTLIVFDNQATGSMTRLFDMTTFRYSDSWASHPGNYPFGRCGQIAASSITHSGTTAIVTVASNAHYVADGGSYVTISGATGADATLYNGTFQTLRNDANPPTATTFRYAMSGTPAGNATGTITTISPFDGNSDVNGYRCLDQAGAGSGDYLSGDGPGFSALSVIGTLNQVAEPVFCVNNTISGVRSDCAPTAGNTAIIVNDRDYFNQVTSFDGTTGAGRGTLASRPATCTVGVGYLATDQGSWNTSGDGLGSGVLYTCTSPDHWATYYTPYNYPHLLRAGS